MPRITRFSLFHENGQTDTEPQSGNCDYKRKHECERISRPCSSSAPSTVQSCCGMEVPRGTSMLFVWQSDY